MANDPASVYHANADVLSRLGNTCESAACSIERKGPTSWPLGLITPSVPAMVNTQKFLVMANVRPAPAMRNAPMISMRRRPIRSARVVRKKETTVSPASVKVRSRPV